MSVFKRFNNDEIYINRYNIYPEHVVSGSIAFYPSDSIMFKQLNHLFFNDYRYKSSINNLSINNSTIVPIESLSGYLMFTTSIVNNGIVKNTSQIVHSFVTRVTVSQYSNIVYSSGSVINNFSGIVTNSLIDYYDYQRISGSFINNYYALVGQWYKSATDGNVYVIAIANNIFARNIQITSSRVNIYPEQLFTVNFGLLSYLVSGTHYSNVTMSNFIYSHSTIYNTTLTFESGKTSRRYSSSFSMSYVLSTTPINNNVMLGQFIHSTSVVLNTQSIINSFGIDYLVNLLYSRPTAIALNNVNIRNNNYSSSNITYITEQDNYSLRLDNNYKISKTFDAYNFFDLANVNYVFLNIIPEVEPAGGLMWIRNISSLYNAQNYYHMSHANNFVWDYNTTPNNVDNPIVFIDINENKINGYDNATVKFKYNNVGSGTLCMLNFVVRNTCNLHTSSAIYCSVIDAIDDSIVAEFQIPQYYKEYNLFFVTKYDNIDIKFTIPGINNINTIGYTIRYGTYNVVNQTEHIFITAPKLYKVLGINNINLVQRELNFKDINTNNNIINLLLTPLTSNIYASITNYYQYNRFCYASTSTGQINLLKLYGIDNNNNQYSYSLFDIFVINDFDIRNKIYVNNVSYSLQSSSYDFNQISIQKSFSTQNNLYYYTLFINNNPITSVSATNYYENLKLVFFETGSTMEYSQSLMNYTPFHFQSINFISYNNPISLINNIPYNYIYNNVNFALQSFNSESDGTYIPEHGIVLLYVTESTIPQTILVSQSITMSYRTEKDILEHKYFCYLNDHEYATLNPTYYNDNDISKNVYTTTIGLYNDKLELLAIAKSSIPIRAQNNECIIVDFDITE